MIPPIPIPPPTYAEIVDAITACGVSASEISIEFQEEVQSDVITIGDLGGAGEARLACVRQAVHPFYLLEIANAAQRAAYYSFASREALSEPKAEAIQWLQSAGMLDRIPRYDPAQGVAAFAEALETACGLERGRVLMPYGTSGLTLRPDFLLESQFEESAEALDCLIRMMAASDASEHNVQLGFIGNEAFGEGEEP